LEQLDFHFGVLEFGQLLANRLDRAAGIGPEDDIKRLYLLAAWAIEQVFERDVGRGAAERRLPALLLSLGRDLPRLPDLAQDVEPLARLGSGVEAGHVDRGRRPGFGKSAVAIERVVHCLDVAGGRA